MRLEDLAPHGPVALTSLARLTDLAELAQPEQPPRPFVIPRLVTREVVRQWGVRLTPAPLISAGRAGVLLPALDSISSLSFPPIDGMETKRQGEKERAGGEVRRIVLHGFL